MLKSFPLKGNLVHVEFFTDFYISQSFYGRCTAFHWAGKATTFTLRNPANGFKQKFFFFSPLVISVVPLNKRIKYKT